MTPCVVSFRFLQAITNAVTDDRVTVAVLQWDGEQLRFASDGQKLAADHGRSTLERALSAIQAQVAQHCPAKGLPPAALREAFPVPEGDGSLLRWGDVRCGFATNPARQFVDLVRLAKLRDGVNLYDATPCDVTAAPQTLF